MDYRDIWLSKKFGVFNHYLYSVQNNPDSPNSKGHAATDWDSCVNDLDVSLIARNLHEMNAGYYFITLMQGRKYMAAPNSVYDSITGCSPGEACSKRDIVLDLYEELSKYNIDLFLYFTGDGPYIDEEDGKKFGFIEPRDKNLNLDFVKKWTAVLEEYAVRYGDKVKGWWIDGCYREYFGYNDKLLGYYYDACKKGNPDALVATNCGVREKLFKNHDRDDYTPGEFNDFTYIPSSRFCYGAQAQILAPLGEKTAGIYSGWGSPGLVRDKEYMLDYIKKVNSAGGVVTVDIALYRDGSFDPAQAELLKYVGNNL